VRRANVFTDRCDFDGTEPDGYRAAAFAAGELVGGKALNVSIYELPLGQSVCPYHYEYEEEWLVVLEGTVVVRTPEGEEELTRGELVCFPPGPDGAHKATNRSDASARIMMFSSAREPSVAVYPDSDKVGVTTTDDKLMLHRGDGNVDYWDGESG
jgi:uncharacterized cupin superfamily protein